MNISHSLWPISSSHSGLSSVPQEGLTRNARTSQPDHPNFMPILGEQLLLGPQGTRIGGLVHPQVDGHREEAHTGLRTNLEIFGREFLGPWSPSVT